MADLDSADELFCNEDDGALIGSDSDVESDKSDFDCDVPMPKEVPKVPRARAPLRDGLSELTDELRAEAATHLLPLPKDYSWIVRMPEVKPDPIWHPNEGNMPNTTPNYANKSLLNIFCDMSNVALTHAINCTNEYGSSKYPKEWPKLTSARILLFISIIFHMDVMQRSSLISYWQKENPDQFVASTGISRKKFLFWYESLRLYSIDSIGTKAEQQRNKVHKVESYLLKVQLAFQRMRHTKSQKLSLDEEMTTFKGRCGLIQIIKNKPRGEGLKYYALCDPISGYVYSTMLHSGTYVPFQEVWGRIVAICYKLTSGSGDPKLRSFLDQGYFIYTDRYYTTVQMNFAMSKRATYFCGTLRREQRSSLPTAIMLGTRRTVTSVEVKNMKRGDIMRRFSNYGETCAISWMDNTLVTFLTSIDDGCKDPTVVYRKGKTKTGHRFREPVCQPETAKDFSTNMGGVDKHDQNTTTVKKHHRSRRWYVSGVFMQSLDWMAHNSFVIWKDFNRESTLKNKDVKVKLSESLRDLALDMIGSNPIVDNDEEKLDYTATKQLPVILSKVQVCKLRFDNSAPHLPLRFLGPSRNCQGHRQRLNTSFFCSRCCIFLCIDGGCFARFHTEKYYLYDDPKCKGRTVARKSEMYL